MANRSANRTRLLFISLLVTSLFLITLDLRGVSVVSTIRNSTQSVLAPIQRVGSNLLSPIGNLFADISNLTQTRSRIQKLESENRELKSQIILNQSIASELNQFKKILDFAGKARYKIVSARVISKGGTATFGDTLVIDQGEKSGIRRDMTVIGGSGLVGVVKSTTADSSVILLLSDPSFRVGVRVAGTQDMGVLSGQGSGTYSLQMLTATGDIKVGDALLSRGSSGDKPFVPGVPVGTITSVENTTGQLTKRARVQGFVDLNSLGVVAVVIAATGSNPGDSLIPVAPAPAPTVTVYVTPTPSPKG